MVYTDCLRQVYKNYFTYFPKSLIFLIWLSLPFIEVLSSCKKERKCFPFSDEKYLIGVFIYLHNKTLVSSIE